MAMPEKTTILEKVPSEVTPEDLAKISDEDLVALHDSIHSMLLKGQIEEDEFTFLRDVIIQEMRTRGIKPLAEYKAAFHSQGPLVNSAYRDLGGLFVKMMENVVTVSPLEGSNGAKAVRINFDAEGLQKNLDDVMLTIAGRYKNSELLAFSSKKDVDGLPLFDAYLVPCGKTIMTRVPSPNGTPEDLEYFSSLTEATGQFFSAARTSSKKNSLEPSRFFRQARHVRGVHPEISQSNEALMDIFSDHQFPIYAVARFSNVDVQIHRAKGVVSIFSQTGKNITALLPQVVERMAAFVPHGKDVIVLATLKFSDEQGATLGTFFTESDLRVIAKDKASQVKIEAKAYDYLFWGEDMHPMPWHKRITMDLPDLPFDSRVVKQINSLKHFSSVVNGFINRRDTAGYMLYEQRPYNLGCFENQIIQVDKAFRFNALVRTVEKTTLPSVNNMRLAVETGSLNFPQFFHVFMNEMNLIDIGQSHASSRWACPGDIMEVEATGLRHRYDARTGLSQFEIVNPRIVNRAGGVGFPSSANTVVEKAVEAGVYTFGLVKADVVRYASTLNKDNPVLWFLWETKPSEIRYRVKDPKGFTDGKWGSIWIKKDKPRVRAIVGVPTGEKASVIQALRFPLEDGWTVAQAKKWVAEHDFSEMFSRPVEDSAEPIDANEVAELFK
jgi:hypothetical protein